MRGGRFQGRSRLHRASRAALSPRVDDPASLRDLLGDCAVVIDCAGPFVKYGEPVLAAAVETGTHYLDTTTVEAVTSEVLAANPHATVVIRSTVPIGFTAGLRE